METPVLVLTGPTAIGKTRLSLEIAARFGCEIISMDSMQVYRFMDIGTAKASPEAQSQVRHYLIDIRNPDEQYDAAAFVRDALVAVETITARGKIPLITGGTGLYLSALINGLFDIIHIPDELRARLKKRLKEEGRAVLHAELCGVDPESGRRIHPNDTQRLLRGLEIFYASGRPWSEHLHGQQARRRFTRILHMGLTCERAVLYDRIKIRTLQMMQTAFKEEVAWLLSQGYGHELNSMQSLGYRHMCMHLSGAWDLQTSTELLIRDTRRYAKRQMTWFRRIPEMHWYEIGRAEPVMADVSRFLRG